MPPRRISSKVVSLAEHKDLRKKAPLVDYLRELQKQARNGELLSLAVVGLYKDGSVSHGSRGTGDMRLIHSGIRVLEMRMALTALCEGEDDGDDED